MKRLLLITILLMSQWSWGIDTTDLIAHWAFEDNLNDSGAGGHTLSKSENGADYAYADGKVGKCLTFANGDCVLVADFLGLDGNTNYTQALWVKRTDITTNINNNLTYKNTTAYMRIRTDLNEYSVMFYDTDGTYQTLVSTGDAAGDTNWHHLLVTHDGATLKLYVDGIVVDDATPANWSGTLKDSGDSLRIGYYVLASIDEVYRFNRVLTENEIDELSMTGDYAPTPTPTITPTGQRGCAQRTIIMSLLD